MPVQQAPEDEVIYMSKEYDDELDRASGPNGRSRARNSEHGTSEDAYYLDDDLSTAG